MGNPCPLSKKVAGPRTQFSARFYCGQTAGCIKMPLGMEVGLSPDDFVLHALCFTGSQLSLKRAQPPVFGSCLLWRNGWWMDKDATWYGSRPRPRSHCIRGRDTPSEFGRLSRQDMTRRGRSSPLKGHISLPSFRPMSVVATVTHLSYC